MTIFSKARKWLNRFPIIKFGSSVTWGFVTGAFLLIIFAILAEDLLSYELGAFDNTIGNYIRSFRSTELNKLAIMLTQLGSGVVKIGLMLVIGGILLFKLKHVCETAILTICLTGGWLFNLVLKETFRRARPDIQHLVEVGGYSFPSGHAMVSTAFYGMLGYLLWLNLRDRSKPSWYVPVLTAVLILSIGLSRIYLGVHFPSDVVAGFATGGLWLTGCIAGLHAVRNYKSIKDSRH